MNNNTRGCNGNNGNKQKEVQYKEVQYVRIQENPIVQTILVACGIVGLLLFILVMLFSF
jgi:hypothetical protein